MGPTLTDHEMVVKTRVVLARNATPSTFLVVRSRMVFTKKISGLAKRGSSGGGRNAGAQQSQWHHARTSESTELVRGAGTQALASSR